MLETKLITLRNHPDLQWLTADGFCWHGLSIDELLLVVAVGGGYGDWTAYIQTPDTGQSIESVADFGDKLPKESAVKIFPEWAKKYKWRY
jgi:hypothetical protein